MTKRAFGRIEGEEQIPWLMHTRPRLVPRWSSKRLLRNKGLRLFLAGLDWSADNGRPCPRCRSVGARGEQDGAGQTESTNNTDNCLVDPKVHRVPFLVWS